MKSKILLVVVGYLLIFSLPIIEAESYLDDAFYSDTKSVDSPLIVESEHYKASLKSAINVSLLKKLAEYSETFARKNNSRGNCLRGVRQTLSYTFGQEDCASTIFPLQFNGLEEDDGGNKHILPGRSSDSFIHWVRENPISLCNSLALADVTNFAHELNQEGLIYFYEKGRCGLHEMYGHAEIVIKSNIFSFEACSDHCRKSNYDCKPSLILAAVSHCRWLHFNTSFASSFLQKSKDQT